MKSRLPWRTHNPTGWAEQCAGLTPLEEWAFLRLSDWQWINGSLPSSPIVVDGWLKACGLTSKIGHRSR